MFIAGPGQRDQHPLPARLGEKFIGIALALFERIVARHLHVAAQRQRADAVVGVAALHAPQARAETDGKNLHAHAKGFGDDEMSPLMDQDHDAQNDRNRNDHY